MSSELYHIVKKAVYVPNEPKLKPIYIPPDVPVLHTLRSYWEKEKGLPPTSPTDYLNVKAEREEWYENNDNREDQDDVQLEIVEDDVQLEGEEDTAHNTNVEDLIEIYVDNEFFNDGVKLKFNHKLFTINSI